MKSSFESKFIKAFLLLVLIVSIFSEALLLFNLLGALVPKKNNLKNVVLSYSIQPENNYDVEFVPNQFVVEEQEGLILEFIDSFTFFTNYKYQGSNDTKIRIKYNIYSKLEAYHKTSFDKSKNPKIWEKRYDLDEQEKNFNEKDFNVFNSIKIEMEKYLTELISFQKDVPNIPIEGYLNVYLDLEIEGDKDGILFSDKVSNKFEIPLSEKVIKITEHLNNVTNKNIYSIEISEVVFWHVLILVLVIVVNFIIIMYLVQILFFNKEKSIYNKINSEIMKNYDEIIITTKSLIEMDSYNIVDVLDFKEMLELSRALDMPILHYEYPNNSKTIYYIIKDKLLYKLEIKNPDVLNYKVTYFKRK